MTLKALHAPAACVLALIGFLVNLVGFTPAEEQNATFPQQVLLIRHAEKPAESDESVHLSPMGRERADKLPQLFEASKEAPARFPTPDFVFAAKDSKHSHRSVETVTPLAKKLKLNINSDFADADYARLTREVLQGRQYAGKVVLICWHHGKAPELARELRAKETPDHWKGDVFDRVWELKYEENGKVLFRDLPQRLLRGDAEK